MTDDGLAAARQTLHRVFGFAAFRAGQEEIVEAVLAGVDVLAVMPTGSGKSLCFQLPALLRPGLTIVVSPLIALMRDQVAQLQALGVCAGSLNSGNDGSENAQIRRRLMAGELRLLYVAPERLLRPEMEELLQDATVRLLAIDEAHCVSQWGHDFRPEYLALGQVRRWLPGVQTIALTATADAATRADIESKLFVSPPRSFVRSFDRPNLHLAMRPKANTRRQLADFIAARRQRSGIVYCASRKRTETLASALAAEGHRALPYHAGLEQPLRARHQDIFQQEDGVIIVATIAFGMGIDKPDVRFVCHADLPSSIESYYQEIGRAGRDGLPAETLTLHGLEDIRLRQMQIDESEMPEERKRIDRARLSALLSLCEAPRCRRQTLLAYFGEASTPCGNCDLCQEGVTLFDGTIEAQKAMSAILRTGQRFGTEHLVRLLTGEADEKIRRFQHDQLPTFGVGRDRSADDWRSIFRQIYAAGLISLDMLEHGSWKLAELGQNVLRGRERIQLRAPAPRAKSQRRRDRHEGVADPAAAAADGVLLAALKALRLELARSQDAPAFVVFSDRTLIEMASRHPTSLAQMREVIGVGEAKLERYGRAFLDVLLRHRDGHARSAGQGGADGASEGGGGRT